MQLSLQVVSKKGHQKPLTALLLQLLARGQRKISRCTLYCQYCM